VAVDSTSGLTLAAAGVDWYAARAGGVVAYILLSAVIVIGLALAGKERVPGWPRFALEDVHRFGGLLVGAFVSAHALMILIDSQAHMSLAQLLIPFSASYRPLWTGLGTVAAELLLALAVANHYRKRISYRLWRRSHYLNFAVWIAATAHGLGAGTDRSSVWFLWMYFIAIGAVAGFTVRRVLRTTAPGVRPNTDRAATTAEPVRTRPAR
jgi:methionine sulfoxide reductase heme-binding subunit